MEFNLNTFRLNQRGLARLFGALEAKVMEVVWELDEPTVHDVIARLGEGANYKTVMTVMNRLVDKGLLQRRKESRAFVYTPTIAREALLENLSRQVLAGLLADFGPAAIAQFVNAVEETDRDKLRDLAALIEHKLGERGSGG